MFQYNNIYKFIMKFQLHILFLLFNISFVSANLTLNETNRIEECQLTCPPKEFCNPSTYDCQCKFGYHLRKNKNTCSRYYCQFDSDCIQKFGPNTFCHLYETCSCAVSSTLNSDTQTCEKVKMYSIWDTTTFLFVAIPALCFATCIILKYINYKKKKNQQLQEQIRALTDSPRINQYELTFISTGRIPNHVLLGDRNSMDNNKTPNDKPPNYDDLFPSSK